MSETPLLPSLGDPLAERLFELVPADGSTVGNVNARNLLQLALRRDVGQEEYDRARDLLAEFHGTVSLPFEARPGQRVAVKIVDDRGIESLKILVVG